jgi:DNA-binding NarL/FixJ family response regulator
MSWGSPAARSYPSVNRAVRVISARKVRKHPDVVTAGRHGRVLIADDKADIRNLLIARLRLDPELEVVGEASNGAEVITKVGELNPAALILDLQMPVMSGEEAIPILRSLAPELRIVAFSAFVGVQDGLRGSLCPDAEVAKGGDLKQLVQAVHSLLADRPDDVMEVELGVFETGLARHLVANWSRLHPDIRAATPAGGPTADLLALTGVFLSLGEQVQRASAQALTDAQLRLSTRRATAQGSRRALAVLEPAVASALDPLHSRLLEMLAREAAASPVTPQSIEIQPLAG